MLIAPKSNRSALGMAVSTRLKLLNMRLLDLERPIRRTAGSRNYKKKAIRPKRRSTAFFLSSTDDVGCFTPYG